MDTLMKTCLDIHASTKTGSKCISKSLRGAKRSGFKQWLGEVFLIDLYVLGPFRSNPKIYKITKW